MTAILHVPNDHVDANLPLTRRIDRARDQFYSGKSSLRTGLIFPLEFDHSRLVEQTSELIINLCEVLNRDSYQTQ